jgi:hypothetical protein
MRFPNLCRERPVIRGELSGINRPFVAQVSLGQLAEMGVQ